jgi:hypothetical protein
MASAALSTFEPGAGRPKSFCEEPIINIGRANHIETDDDRAPSLRLSLLQRGLSCMRTQRPWLRERR